MMRRLGLDHAFFLAVPLGAAVLVTPLTSGAQASGQPAACAQVQVLRTLGQKAAAQRAQQQCTQALAARSNAAPPAKATPAAAPGPAAPAPAAAPAPTARGRSNGPQAAAPMAPAAATAVTDTSWLAAMPSGADASAKLGADAARRDGGLETLKDYIDTRLGQKVMFAGSFGPLPPDAVKRWNEYRAAQSQQRVGKAVIANVLSSEAQRYFDNPKFRLEVLSKLVSPQAAAVYRNSAAYKEVEQTAAVQDRAAKNVEFQKQIASEKRAGTDSKVFGIELGESLQLPPCKDETSGGELFSAMAGVGRGGSETCAGDPATTMAMGFLGLAQMATGTQGPQSSVSPLPARLADKMCPEWVKTGGSCSVILSMQNGVVLGATVVPGGDNDTQAKVVRELGKKYGKPTGFGDGVECRSNLTGAVTREAKEVLWKLPGLHVTYSPLVTDCKRGRVSVELDYLHRLRANEQAAHEDAEPKM
jgi:hypothetical protein